MGNAFESHSHRKENTYLQSLAEESGHLRKGLIWYRRRLNELQNRDSLSTKCRRPTQRLDERIEVMNTSCPYGDKLFLKAAEPQSANSA